MISIKSKEEIALMRESGKRTAQILDELERKALPGVTTGELDRFAERRCQELGCKPAFKGYNGFPFSVCISINDEAIHGLPSDTRRLKSGDIVGLDFGVIYEGWYSDSARTVSVGIIGAEASKLLDVAKESLALGIQQCKAGNRLSDIGHAVQGYAENHGYGVVREYSGHGIGRSLHEEPHVPNHGEKGHGLILEVGMVFAIEPMINVGKKEVVTLNDGWTIATKDRSLSAHFEHTVAITEDGPEILTKR